MDWLSRVSEDDVISNFASIFTDPDEDDLRMMDKVQELMDQIPPIEADFVRLYFFLHVKQTDIAEIFGVSQPTVCYRLKRAIRRIKYLLEVPRLDPEALREGVSGFLSDPLDVQILILMYETTCQSETAKRLGVTQGLVRHRFFRSIERMSENPNMRHYAGVFEAVAANLNLLREVRRPVRSARSGFFLDS